jgi:hypothetical protein
MVQKGGLGPEGYRLMQEIADVKSGKRVSRSDGLDALIPYRTYVDPDFGMGYDVVDPAPSRNSGRSRAQKLGYNAEMQYLAIKMRDDTIVGYPGVTLSEWNMLGSYSSTTDYIEGVLGRYVGGQWDTVTGTPPQSNEQSFGQGTID